MAMQDIHRILDLDRNPRLAANVSHDYSDKYALANAMTNTAIIAQMNVLHRLGLTNDILQTLDPTKPTTLRFQASDSCQYLKEQVVDVPLPVTVESVEDTETSGDFVGKTTKSSVHKVVNRIKEFHWEVAVEWELSVYAGTNVDQRQILDRRTSCTTLIVRSSTQAAPLPEHRDHKPIEMPLTWLLKQIDLEQSSVHFTIDTQDEDTKTPRRNKQVEAAITFYMATGRWMRDVRRHFTCTYVTDIIHKHNPADPSPSSSIVGSSEDLQKLDPNVFIPIVPLMEDREANGRQDESIDDLPCQSVLCLSATNDSGPSGKTRVLSTKDTTRLLNEHN